MPAHMRDGVAAALSNPKFLEIDARMRRLAARGPVAFAITERHLPNDLAAMAMLAQPGPVPR